METQKDIDPARSPEAQAIIAKADAEERAWVLQQKQIAPYWKSDLVPTSYRGKPENCIIACQIAKQIGAHPLSVMQNLYVIQGKPSWSAKFAISRFNSCGKFTAIKYEEKGEGDSFSCTAYAKEKATGEIVKGIPVTWEMVKAEGWLSKNGSKWKTMPRLMFRYRAAAYLIATTAPEITSGLSTAEEMEDITETPIDAEVIVDAPKASTRLASLMAETGNLPETEKTPSQEAQEAPLREKEDKVVAPTAETPKKGNSVPGKGKSRKSDDLEAEIQLETEGNQ